jgi:hypothetical protein
MSCIVLVNCPEHADKDKQINYTSGVNCKEDNGPAFFMPPPYAVHWWCCKRPYMSTTMMTHPRSCWLGQPVSTWQVEMGWPDIHWLARDEGGLVAVQFAVGA